MALGYRMAQAFFGTGLEAYAMHLLRPVVDLKGMDDGPHWAIFLIWKVSLTKCGPSQCAGPRRYSGIT